MYIKAKYPSLYRPYMKDVRQGIGSTRGGNQISAVSSTITERNIEESHDGDFNS